MQLERLFTRNLFWIVSLTVLISSVVLGVWTGQKKIHPLPSLSQNSYNCAEPFSENPEVLTVYTTERAFTNALLIALCDDIIVQRQFGNVSVVIGSNDFDTFKHINYGIADLALVKQNLITAFASEQVQGFSMIAKYPNYRAYFIAKNEKPILSKEYLLGKRIGLLDYPSSRSGHIAPKIALQRLGISADNANLHYFNTHSELREKLLVGDIDIISSYWDRSDRERLSENYKIEINANVSGAKWFLRQQTRNTELICALQQIIQSVSKNHSAVYYRGIQLTAGCDTEFYLGNTNDS